MSHKAVPECIALSFPFIAVTMAFVFAYSAAQVGTTVDISFTAGGQTTYIDDAFTFSLLTSTRDSWNAGAYCISCATLLFSGLWPHVKLFLMCYCWVAPRHRLGVDRRARILNFLDAYGKYSLLDTFLALFAFAAYRMEWQGPRSSLLVQPVAFPPFFAFVLATVVSLVLGHIAAHYHHKIEELDQKLASGKLESVIGPIGRRVPLYSYASASGPLIVNTGTQVGFEKPWRQSPGSVWAVVAALIVTIILMLTAASLDSFKIWAGGVAAGFIADPDGLMHHYSFFTFAADIAKGDNKATPKLLQAVFMCFVFIIPLVSLLALLLLWVLPLSASEQKIGLLACKVLNCWDSLDVFILALIVARFEVGKFAEFLVYDDNVAVACGWVRDNMKTDCFAVGCEVTWGFIVLFLAGALNVVVQRATIAECQAAFDQAAIDFVLRPAKSREIWLPGFDEEVSEDVVTPRATPPGLPLSARLAKTCGHDGGGSSRGGYHRARQQQQHSVQPTSQSVVPYSSYQIRQVSGTPTPHCMVQAQTTQVDGNHPPDELDEWMRRRPPDSRERPSPRIEQDRGPINFPFVDAQTPQARQQLVMIPAPAGAAPASHRHLGASVSQPQTNSRGSLWSRSSSCGTSSPHLQRQGVSSVRGNVSARSAHSARSASPGIFVGAAGVLVPGHQVASAPPLGVFRQGSRPAPLSRQGSSVAFSVGSSVAFSV